LLDRYAKNNQISVFIKVRPVVAELFHADGWTDAKKNMTKPIAAIHNFANEPISPSSISA